MNPIKFIVHKSLNFAARSILNSRSILKRVSNSKFPNLGLHLNLIKYFINFKLAKLAQRYVIKCICTKNKLYSYRLDASFILGLF